MIEIRMYHQNLKEFGISLYSIWSGRKLAYVGFQPWWMYFNGFGLGRWNFGFFWAYKRR